ncbi:hypothetical protein K439DRAFT_1622745 [Ramaria rubella]|nr:hypothetical protein K439DRAFT_1622745 [Ramaria rubella]
MRAKAGCVRGVDENSPTPDQEQTPQQLIQQPWRLHILLWGGCVTLSALLQPFMSLIRSFIHKICIQRVQQIDDIVKLFGDMWKLITGSRMDDMINVVVSLEDGVLVVREVYSTSPPVSACVGTAFEDHGDDNLPVTGWTYAHGGFIQEFAMRPAAVRVGVQGSEMRDVLRYREDWLRGEPWWLEPV